MTAKNKSLTVSKANKIIEARYKLNLIEQKLILFAISQLDSIHQEEFNIQRFSIKVLSEAIGEQEHRYSEIRKVVRALRKKELIIHTEDKEIITGWLSSITFEKNTGMIELEFSKKLMPFLLKLRSAFKSYKFENIVKMNSIYAIRIYEMLKQWDCKRNIEISIDELRKRLKIENEYSRFTDFEKRVLKVAKAEINSHSDIHMDYEKIKEGRKITKIKFTIEPKEVDEDQALMEALSSDQERMAIRVKCGFENEKFSDKQVMELYEAACKISDRFNIDPYAYIKLNHEYMQRQSDVKSRFAYLKKAICEDFAGAILKIAMGQKE